MPQRGGCEVAEAGFSVDIRGQGLDYYSVGLSGGIFIGSNIFLRVVSQVK